MVIGYKAENLILVFAAAHLGIITGTFRCLLTSGEAGTDLSFNDPSNEPCC